MALVDKKTQEELEEYKKRHGSYPGCNDIKETREEAIKRTSDDANYFIKKLRQINSGE